MGQDFKDDLYFDIS